MRRVEISDVIPVTEETGRGVTVTVSEIKRDFRSLRDGTALDDLAQIFALYIRQYPKVQILYDHTLIDPRAVGRTIDRLRSPGDPDD